MKSFCKIVTLILQIGALLSFSTGCGSGASAGETINPNKAKLEKLKPTIYFIKVINLSKKCDDKRTIYDASEKAVVRVCANQYKLCVLEGTCALIENANSETEILEELDTSTNEIELINYHKMQNGKYLFTRVDRNRCPFGYGARGLCLDPFYTVAADLTIHKLGDVIFVPSIKGIKLPNGEIHDGFLIVRDKGGAIKGKNRFDFFTSYYNSRRKENPFVEIGLGNSKVQIEFFWVTEKIADEVRQARRFPLTPYSK